ncbi:MAG: hypothetical protein ACYTGB_09420 [Planctomycetota bacterium]|jgi:hypothetical protein
MRTLRRRLPALAALALLAGLAAGCMQLETRIRLNPDMTATVTERLRLSRRLLDLAGEKRGELVALLSKESALRRMKRMGEGVSLVSHQVREAEGASRESVAVFKVAALDGFKYVSPWPSYADFPANNVIGCKVEPILRNRDPYNEKPGDMAVSFLLPKRPPRVPKAEDIKPQEGFTPLKGQVYRELGPVFRDMLTGFKVRLTFESYAPVLSRLGVRGKRAGVTEVDLISFSDRDLDRWGGLFLENEELSNLTLPVYLRRGGNGTRICFRPSRPFFDKYLAGKTLSSPWWRERTEKADFARIGWRPLRTRSEKEKGSAPEPKPGEGERK